MNQAASWRPTEDEAVAAAVGVGRGRAGSTGPADVHYVHAKAPLRTSHAIRDAGLGLNPATQGNLIRVPLPALSEERRKELVKVVHKLAEEGRIAVRHARTETMSKIKKLEKVPEDDKARAEKDVQKLTDDHVKQIDGLIQHKEAEIMEV